MGKKKIALIHTVAWYNDVIGPYLQKFLDRHDDCDVVHILDSSLLEDSLKAGAATPDVLRRIVNYFQCADNIGVDLAMCTCTTVNRAAQLAREMLNIPAMNIDEPMAKFAVEAGEKIGILGTLYTSVPCTVRLLKDYAKSIGKDVEIVTALDEPAFAARMRGDIAEHDRLACESLKRLAEKVDVIALGQISLSQVKCDLGKPIFQVGDSAFEEIERILYK